MQEERQRIYTIVAIVALVGLLFSCVAGALAGGVAGFVAGQRQGRAAAQQALAGGPGAWPGFPRGYPMPWYGPKEGERPFEGMPPGMMPPGMAPPEGMPPFGVQGAIIQEVIPDSPADEAGLEAGDVIVAVDDTPIDHQHPLPRVIRQYEPGDRVTIVFRRGDSEERVRVKLSEHPEDPGQAYLGVYFVMPKGPGFEPPHD